MRLISVGIALLLGAGLLFATPAAALAESEDELTLIGGGWGHGVGLSQYGTLDMAKNGATSTEIIQHYYSGTTVEDVTSVTSGDPWLEADDALWVALDEDATSVTFRPLAPVTLCIHSYTTECPQEREVAAGQQVVIADTGDGCTAAIDGEVTYGPGSCAFSVPTAAAYIEIESMPLLNGNPRRYHRGSLEIRPAGLAPANDTERLAWIVTGPFHVTWSTSLDTYMEGIAEVPSSWPTAALEAQAIAARSYAVARSLGRETGDRTLTFLGDPGLTASRADLCWCHVDDGNGDQVYQGWPQDEDPDWTAAAAATSGQVAVHDGIVATGFYSSSTSGVTESMESGFAGSFVPYLVSVDDAGSQSPANPYAEWTLTLDPDTVAGLLGWDSVTSASLGNGPPGAAIDFEGVDNGAAISATVTARSLRASLSGLGITMRSPGVTSVVGPGEITPAFGGDFTGNGSAEVASYNEDTGEWTVTTATSSTVWVTLGVKTGWEFMQGEFTGDGRTDIAAYHEATGRWWVFRSTGTSFKVAPWVTFGTKKGWEFHVGDFTGDGLDDVAAYHDGTGRWWIARSSGTAFSLELWVTFFTKTGWTFNPGDFTGDGRMDIAAYHPATGRWWVARSTGTSFLLEHWATFATKAGWEFWVSDLEGDGTDDVVAYHEGAGRWWVVRSAGDDFTAELWGSFAVKTGWISFPGDFDGDGRGDMASYHHGAGKWYVQRSTGSDYDLDLWDIVSNEFTFTYLPGDYNGDGNDDILGGRAGFHEVIVAQSTGSSFVQIEWR